MCIFASPDGIQRVLELQTALAEYRMRLLKNSKWATFESLKEWHKACVEAQFRDGQDRPEGWRVGREDLTNMLRKKM